MKQILSVADFALILNMINERIDDLELTESSYTYSLFKDTMTKKQYYQEIEKRKQELQENSYYKQLIHLRDSLQNLNIEVECPDIKVVE